MQSKLIEWFIKVYQIGISPVAHWICGPTFGCRFIPSCSDYAHEAFRKHGLLRGGLLSFFRICRCHPFSLAGYDPVPHDIGHNKLISNFSTEGK